MVSDESANSSSNTTTPFLIATQTPMISLQTNLKPAQPNSPYLRSSHRILTVLVQVQRNISCKPTACSN